MVLYKEVTFYEGVLLGLRKLDDSISAPRFLYKRIEEGIIMMEDMADAGFHMAEEKLAGIFFKSTTASRCPNRAFGFPCKVKGMETRWSHFSALNQEELITEEIFAKYCRLRQTAILPPIYYNDCSEVWELITFKLWNKIKSVLRFSKGPLSLPEK
jgi:hypothetical protein